MESSQEQQKKQKSGRWNIFKSCLFDYKSKEENMSSENDRNNTGTSQKDLQSSIVLNQMNKTRSNAQIQIYNTHNQLGINNDKQSQNIVSQKQQKSQFSNQKQNKPSEIQSQITSGLNSPNIDLGHHFNNSNNNNYDNRFNQNGQQQGSDKKGITEKDKAFACSLDASNMEDLQKIIEKKQLKDYYVQQQLDQQVKQIFPLQKIFFLRDQKNQYSTLAYCTQQHFYINLGTFNNSVISNSNRNASNILNNTNLLFKVNPNNNNNNNNNNNAGNNNNNNNNNTSNINTSNKINISQDSNASQSGTMLSNNNNYNNNNSRINQSTNASNNNINNSSNVDFLNYQNLYHKFKPYPIYSDNFTPQKIALHIAQTFRKYNLLIDACCGSGGNAIQFARFNKMVIAIDKNPQVLNACYDNLINHNQDKKNLNVELICEDFLNLDCGQFQDLRADIVFINPQVELPTDSAKANLFTQCEPKLVKAMKNGYKMSKNIAILLPSYIDTNHIPIIIDKFQRCFLPSHIIEHHCPHIELIYLNGKIKYFLIKIGEISKMQPEDELKFLIEQLRENSYYKGPYEDKIYELFQSIQKRGGMKQLMSTFVKSIDLNDLKKQKDLLNTLIDELIKSQLVQQSQIKQIFNITNNLQSNNFCESQTDLKGSQDYIHSYTSDHSFQLSLGYGSYEQNQQSPSQDKQSPQQNQSKQVSFDKQSNDDNSGFYQIVESSLGDQIENLEFEDDSYDNQSNNDSDFYFDEHNNIPFDGAKKNNPHNMINTL